MATKLLGAGFAADRHDPESIVRECLARLPVSLDRPDDEAEFAQIPGKSAQAEGAVPRASGPGRRRLLVAGATLPLLASCAGGLGRYRADAVAALATRFSVCAAVYCLVKAGRAQPPVALSGCHAPTATDTIFQAASLTKPLTALAVLRLVQAGVLDLQAPVSRYLPRGYIQYRSSLRRGPGDPSYLVAADVLARIPLGTLLNHSSGLPNWSSTVLSLAFAPGERWQYSGEAYVLLQAVIEAVTGQPLARYMDEQVFQPLGMPDSSLVWHDGLAARAAVGTAAGGARRQLVFRWPVAAASLYTTASDYARLIEAFCADPALLALTLSRPVEVDRGLQLGWGYGWGIERRGADTVLWQWGNNPGFRAFAMFSASTQDGFVLLTNSDQGMPLAPALAEQSLPGEHPLFRFSMVN